MVHEQTDLEGVVSYHYSVGFLLAGHYEVAFTCDGETFDSAEVKPAEFIARQRTEVSSP